MAVRRHPPVAAWASVGLALAVGAGCNGIIGVDDFGVEPASGSTGVGGGAARSDADGGAGGVGVAGYACRREIRIDSAVDAEAYTIVLEVDHAALVAAGKSLPSGDDLRVLQEHDAGDADELPRAASPRTPFGGSAVELAIRLPALRREGNAGYALVYGAPDADRPPDDPRQVYDVWDDFAGAALDDDWIAEPIGSGAVGTAVVDGGQLSITGSGQGLGAAGDSLFFVHRELSRDFVAETMVESEQGNGPMALVGGLMARPAASPTEPFALISYQKQDQGSVWRGWRASEGAAVGGEGDASAPATLPVYLQLRRTDRTFRGSVASPGQPFVDAGQGMTLEAAFPEPFRVGVPLANLEDGVQSSVRVGWFSARRVARPAPQVSLGPEHCR